MRTSSAANVGADKDSEKRQRHAIQGFAKRSGSAIVEEFYDAAVSGADPNRLPNRRRPGVSSDVPNPRRVTSLLVFWVDQQPQGSY